MCAEHVTIYYRQRRVLNSPERATATLQLYVDYTRGVKRDCKLLNTVESEDFHVLC